MIHSLAARALIKDYEGGMFDVDVVQRDEMKQTRKPELIAISCKHNVVSPFTSFVAVEERKEVSSINILTLSVAFKADYCLLCL